MVRAKRPRRVPVVMTPEEVWRVIGCLDGPTRTVALLRYGSGLRLMECLTLRVHDLDFEGREVTVRGGKVEKDRRTVLPAEVSVGCAGVGLAVGVPRLSRLFGRRWVAEEASHTRERRAAGGA